MANRGWSWSGSNNKLKLILGESDTESSFCAFWIIFALNLKWRLNPRYTVDCHARQLKAAAQNCASCCLTWAPYTYLSSIFPPNVWPPMSHTCRVTFMLPAEEKRDKILKYTKIDLEFEWQKAGFCFLKSRRCLFYQKFIERKAVTLSLCFKVAISTIIANMYVKKTIK